MNKDVQKFLEKNDIDIKKVSQEVDCSIVPSDEINRIVSDYGVFKLREKEHVSVADILGYGIEHKKNIFLSIEDFFDSEGDGYHSRSVGLLNTSPEIIIQKMEENFYIDPMVVDDMGDGKYAISENGLHRYTVFRTLYLSEYAKVKGDPISEEKLRKKYTLPVDFRKLDEIKTYSKYCLMTFSTDIKRISLEYNEDFKLTGRVIVLTNDNRKVVLDDTALVSLVRKRMKGINPIFLKSDYQGNSGFRKFVDQNLSDIIETEQLQAQGGIYGRI